MLTKEKALAENRIERIAKGKHMSKNIFSITVVFLAFGIIWAQQTNHKEGGKMNSPAMVI